MPLKRKKTFKSLVFFLVTVLALGILMLILKIINSSSGNNNSSSQNFSSKIVNTAQADEYSSCGDCGCGGDGSGGSGGCGG